MFKSSPIYQALTHLPKAAGGVRASCALAVRGALAGLGLGMVARGMNAGIGGYEVANANRGGGG